MPEARKSTWYTHLPFLLTILAITVLFVTFRDHGIRFVSLLASSASSLDGNGAVLYFAPHAEHDPAIGEHMSIDVRVNSSVPINAIGATIELPQSLEILGISKKESFFDLWTEETVIDEQRHTIRFSGGTLDRGGHSGIGTVMTITVRGTEPGRAELRFSDITVLVHDGKGTKALSAARTYAYTVRDTPAPELHADTRPPAPSADLNNDGKVSLADMSILTIQFLSSYNARYDLNSDGSLSLADLSVLFSHLRNN